MGEAAAASAYVAGVGALTAVSASDESKQTKPSFIQLFTFVMASVCGG